MTGNPVRGAMARVLRSSDTTPRLIAIVGGSLGARQLNDAALALHDQWRQRVDIAIRHVSGPRDYERCMERIAELRRDSDTLSYEIVRYEEDMPGLYGRTAVLVCRAGAVTCAEVAVTGTPALLVPLPGAPGDHQTLNARALVEAGAAAVVPDAELDGARLARELAVLLESPDRLDAMGRAARTIGHPDAADLVAVLVEETARDA